MMDIPIEFGASTDEVLQTAYRAYSEDPAAIQVRATAKRGLLRQYDPPGMIRAANICHWGRSGSFLLASYLDSHPDIVMLPMLESVAIYPFFHEYEGLSVWEKLIAYPTYSGLKKGIAADFFSQDNPDGNFAIHPADYYAAVLALYEVYGSKPVEWLSSSVRFFQFLHVAYAVAIGQRPETAQPLMVWSQHYVDEQWAQRFIEDFPRGQFIHTIRDPISSIDSWFSRQSQMEMDDCGHRPELAARYLDPAVATMKNLLCWDSAHDGTHGCSRAIRFEDMHLEPETLMRRLVAWLGVAFHPCLLESTWNGTPYVVQIRGVSWCGPNPANTVRRFANLAFTDRLMVFAVLHDNFVVWNYPSPRALGWWSMRLFTVALFWIVPMRIELMTARLVLRGQVLPGLRKGRAGFAVGGIAFLLKRRLRMMCLIAAELAARLSGRRRVLQLL
jgi:hypothetical protein